MIMIMIMIINDNDSDCDSDSDNSFVSFLLYHDQSEDMALLALFSHTQD